jgi:hypothetical protein
VLLEPKTTTRGIDELPLGVSQFQNRGIQFTGSWIHDFQFTGLVLQVIFADRMENVECHGCLVKGPHAVDDSAGDAPLVAGAEETGNSAHCELEPSFKQYAHLFMGMGVFDHHRFRLEAHDRKHQIRAGSRLDLDTGKDLMSRPGPRRDEIGIGGLRLLLVFVWDRDDHSRFP